MKKKHFLDLVLLLLAVFVLYRQLPVWINSFKLEGQQAHQVRVSNLDGQKIAIPSNEKKIYIFWATWCGPCKILLSQFNKAIAEKKLEPEDIFAVNLGESPKTVSNFLSKQPLQMKVVLDPANQSGQLFQVLATPTVVFVDRNREIDYHTSGISPLAVWRAERFLKTK